jgi:hypothetical protein
MTNDQCSRSDDWAMCGRRGGIGQIGSLVA